MIYYLETNLIAIVIALILLIQNNMVSSKRETSNIVFDFMLWALIVVCVTDVTAYGYRGVSMLGAQISNVIYFISIALGTYAWFLFVLIRVGRTNSLRRALLFTSGPIVVLCIGLLLNPFTNFFYTIDQNAIYHRDTGVVISWVVEWGYILLAFITNIMAIISEKRKQVRLEQLGYLMFLIPIIASAVVQMFFYGVTSTQIGYMIALLLVYLNKQYYEVQTDALTGLSNRGAIFSFRDSVLSSSKEAVLTMFMIDSDDFRSINDKYGHLKGDQALRDIAEILIRSKDIALSNNGTVYRYGGDKFVVIGNGITPEETVSFCDKVDEISEEVNAKNTAAGEKYKISLSVGVATKICLDNADFDVLIKDTATSMYNVKKYKSSRMKH